MPRPQFLCQGFIKLWSQDQLWPMRHEFWGNGFLSFVQWFMYLLEPWQLSCGHEGIWGENQAEGRKPEKCNESGVPDCGRRLATCRTSPPCCVASAASPSQQI